MDRRRVAVFAALAFAAGYQLAVATVDGRPLVRVDDALLTPVLTFGGIVATVWATAVWAPRRERAETEADRRRQRNEAARKEIGDAVWAEIWPLALRYKAQADDVNGRLVNGSVATNLLSSAWDAAGRLADATVDLDRALTRADDPSLGQLVNRLQSVALGIAAKARSSAENLRPQDRIEAAYRSGTTAPLPDIAELELTVNDIRRHTDASLGHGQWAD